MAYDESVAARLRTVFAGRPDVVEKKMFGGVAYMMAGNMCCCVIENRLMARVGPAQYADALRRPFAREMDFSGRPMKGYVYVEPEGFATEAELRAWVVLCERFIETLPPK